MKHSKQLADRFREVLLNGKWIANTNFKDLLSSVTWQHATKKVGSLNTIAALAFHVNYYIAGILNVFEGGELEIRDKYSFDMPPLNSKADWDQLLNDMWTNSEMFANHVESLSNEALSASFVKEQYGSYQRNIEAIIEHSYYHLGQISLINKMTHNN